MKNYPTSSSMFSLSSSPLFHTSGTLTATAATPATAAVATFDSSPSTLNNTSSLTMMSKNKYSHPSSSSSMILPMSLSSPIFPTSNNTIAISNCTAIATAIAIVTETTATDDSDSDTATDDSNTDTDNDDSPALPEPSLPHQQQQQQRDQHQDQDQDQDQQRKKSRSVHFLSMVAVRKTISRHEMTQEEKYNCWFQANEYLMIKQNNYDIIITNDQQQLLLAAAAAAGQGSSQQQQQHSNILHNSSNNDNMDSESSSSSSSSLESELSLCMRGLEWGIESESIRKKTYRLGALEEVFIEQEEQYLGDYYNDEAIAYAYYSVSHECQLHAERIAIQDRKDIEEYIYEGLYETI